MVEFKDILSSEIEKKFGYGGKTKIANLVGATPQNVSDWTKGRGQPNIKQLNRLSVALEIPVGRLTGEESPKPEPKVADLIHRIHNQEALLELRKEDSLVKAKKLAELTRMVMEIFLHPKATDRNIITISNSLKAIRENIAAKERQDGEHRVEKKHRVADF